jgi:O-antigen/teichoic acid export membrane protein
MKDWIFVIVSWLSVITNFILIGCAIMAVDVKVAIVCTLSFSIILLSYLYYRDWFMRKRKDKLT